MEILAIPQNPGVYRPASVVHVQNRLASIKERVSRFTPALVSQGHKPVPAAPKCERLAFLESLETLDYIGPELFIEGQQLIAPDEIEIAPETDTTPASLESLGDIAAQLERQIELIELHDKFCAFIFDLDQRRCALAKEVEALENCRDTYFVGDESVLREKRRKLDSLSESLFAQDQFGFPIPSSAWHLA